MGAGSGGVPVRKTVEGVEVRNEFRAPEGRATLGRFPMLESLIVLVLESGEVGSGMGSPDRVRVR